MLRTDISALLGGFDSRMKFIGIVRAMLDYTPREAVKAMHLDKGILDNLIVMVLVFIKERTLSSEQSCKMADIVWFLESLAPILPPDAETDFPALAKFIMIDVLQNGGVPAEYPAWDNSRNAFVRQTIRLIQEQNGSYHITDDAFDFLFRSKEIESELDYSVTRFRMKEYMKRDNYLQALDQSRELVSRIRNMKTSMDDFLLRCREQLSSVTEDAYDAVITRIRALLTDEEQELNDIRLNAQERAAKLDTALQSGIDPEETKRHRAALQEIIRNINLTITEQRGLINKRYRFQDEFEQILQDHYVLQHLERMSFRDEILTPLEHMGTGIGDAARFLLFPLTRPAFARQFSPESFYAAQSRMNDAQEEQGVWIDETEDNAAEEQIRQRNERYLAIMRELFTYLQTQDKPCWCSTWVTSIPEERLSDFCEDNSLPNVLLALYEIGDIDIAGWKAAHDPIPEPMGEFEAAWCLGEMDAGLLDMQNVLVTRQNRMFSFSVRKDDFVRNIDMTDFRMEVIR